jgi:hypothetical protein
MPSRVLITTTIRVPHNLRGWRRAFNDDDVFIVAGDKLTPHNEVVAFLKTLPGDNRYLHPADACDWECDEIIGWNSVQRRNIALLEAMMLKPECIITVDDDNFLIDAGHMALVDDYLDGSNNNYNLIISPTGWFNVGSLLEPPCIHRGYPLDERPASFDPNILLFTDVSRDIGVVASLWLGDPDVDSWQRMARNMHISGLHDCLSDATSVVLETNTWCPFNSQATAYRAALAPLMCVWPHVGRYDDIWSSYAARVVMDAMGLHVLYGHPLVNQTRNSHNMLRDLENEMLGMQYTGLLCHRLRNSAPTFGHLYQNVLPDIDFIPNETKAFFSAWLRDVARATDRPLESFFTVNSDQTCGL